MSFFRKKPVTIEAREYRVDVPETIVLALAAWCGGVISEEKGGMLIPTREGEMLASPGDWIIKGVAGEFYPCKPDIFEATYTPTMGDGDPNRPSIEELLILQLPAGHNGRNTWLMAHGVGAESNGLRKIREHRDSLRQACMTASEACADKRAHYDAGPRLEPVGLAAHTAAVAEPWAGIDYGARAAHYGGNPLALGRTVLGRGLEDLLTGSHGRSRQVRSMFEPGAPIAEGDLHQDLEGNLQLAREGAIEGRELQWRGETVDAAFTMPRPGFRDIVAALLGLGGHPRTQRVRVRFMARGNAAVRDVELAEVSE